MIRSSSYIPNNLSSTTSLEFLFYPASPPSYNEDFLKWNFDGGDEECYDVLGAYPLDYYNLSLPVAVNSKCAVLANTPSYYKQAGS